MTQECTLGTVHKGSAAILRIGGEVTAEADPQLDAAHRALLAKGVRCIIYDFTGIKYINSAGLAILLDFVTMEEEDKPEFRAFGMNSHFEKIIRMVGMDSYVTLFATEKEALGK